MKHCYLIILLLFLAPSLFSQESKDVKPDRKFVNQFYDAEAYIYELNYDMALEILLNLIEQDPDNANIRYKIGFCYLYSRVSQSKAEEYLSEASNNVSKDYKSDSHREKRAPLETYLYLGQAYRYNYEFDHAKTAFNDLLDLLDEKNARDTALISQTKRELEITENAIYFTNNPVDAEIRNLGPAINSEYSDHSPVIDMNEDYLVYTSRRPRANEESFNQDEDIFVSKNKNYVWGNSKRLDNHINTDQNEASIGLSADGKTMFIFRSEGPNYGNVMVSHSEKNLEEWSEPELLSADINSKYRETHATLSPDGNTLYFVSNREGEDAVGGRDIYVMHLLPDGTWSLPRCLPNTINTIYDEETPFIHPDGVTMFFSSKGHNSMGGYDVFYSKIIGDNEYEEPVNLGYPINTTGDDVSYVLNLDGRRGYMASVKDEGYGDFDIYEIIQSGIYINDMVVFTGLVSDLNNNVPKDMTIRVINKKDKKVQGIYRASADNGNYYLILNPGQEYIVEYDAAGHLLASAEVAPQKEQVQSFGTAYIPVQLDPVALLAYKYQDTVYFEYESDVMAGDSYTNLNKVINRSESSDNMVININYPSGRETEFLIKQRSDKIVDYLVEKGINERTVYFNGDFPAGYNDVYSVEMAEYRVVAVNDNNTNLPIHEVDTTVVATVSTGDTVYVDPVFFAFDRYNVQSTYFNNLNNLASYMVNNPMARVQVAGHTDWYGTNEYNYLLSYHRSKAVKDYLVAKGVNPENLITQKYGEAEPIANNANSDGTDNPVGRQYNRRVAFSVLQQGNDAVLIPRGISVENSSVNNNTQFASTTDPVASSNKFTVQIMALRNEKPVNYFADLIGVKLHQGSDGWFRYYVGEFNTRSEAAASADRLRAMGYEPFVRKLNFFK
jgi:outer membrane protein OmpA-like peptidoglycan-associated protein/tetratricopeptide (TPR) repeat protein